MYSLIHHGRRLQKWHNLSAPVKLLKVVSSYSNYFSSASATLVSPQEGQSGKIFSVSYLVDSLGFTTKLAESISRKVSSEEKGNPDSVLRLLKSYGFKGSQISSIVRVFPRLLIADAEKSLGPKLQFLQSRGASTSELTQILTKVPKILGMKGDITVSRYYDFVKEVIEADKNSDFKKLCQSSLSQGKQENKLRNLLVLRELGVPQKLLFSMLVSNLQSVSGKEKFEESLKKVVGMGFDPTTSNFTQALHAVYQMSDKTTERKVNVVCKKLGIAVGDVWEMFKKCPHFLKLSEKKILNSIETYLGLGFSRDEFAMMVKGQPQCFHHSAELVRKKTEFLVKKMNWPVKALVKNPAILGYNLERRTIPRCKVIEALMSKGLLQSEVPPMASVLFCRDEVFLKRYVRKHVDKELVAELMDIFTKDRV